MLETILENIPVGFGLGLGLLPVLLFVGFFVTSELFRGELAKIVGMLIIVTGLGLVVRILK